jgi:hypothetical protein
LTRNFFYNIRHYNCFKLTSKERIADIREFESKYKFVVTNLSGISDQTTLKQSPVVQKTVGSDNAHLD